MRKSSIFFAFCAILAAAAGILYAHSAWKMRSSIAAMERKAAAARYLQATDLCLFTEARYTRHLSQADLHSPFQEHPVALDHFPSGSLVGPPAMLRKTFE
jgi:hypothetical protein